MSVEEIEDIYPLSPLQQGILFHTLYAPESGEYFRQSLYELRGRLNVAAFGRAWRRAVERHAVLRTAFVWEDVDEPLQVVQGGVQLPLDVQDWRGLLREERRARLASFVEDDRRRGFDLAAAPLLRVALLRSGEDVYHCLLSYHHIVLDGWSKALLLREVFALYESFSGEGAAPAGRARPFRDYVAWLRRQDMTEAEHFWRRALAGVSAPTPLGAGRAAARAADSAAGYGERRLRLSEETTDALRSLARRRNLTLNTLVQGAWAILLGRYSGEREVVFGATVSGRPPELEGVESMVGMFINTLPVRARVEPGAGLLEWLGELQARQVEMRQYEYSPLSQVQGWSDVPRGRPLFESILIFENYPVGEGGEPVGGGLVVARGEELAARTNYPLSIFAVPARGLLLQADYDRARIDDASAERLLGHLGTLLEAFADDPERKLGALPVLTEGERRELLVGRNRTATAPRAEHCVHELFERQAARTPDAVAVLHGDEQLTYGELERRANRLANRLLKLGAGPDVLVGICVERSPAMLTALLAVLKSGAAYVPLDPAYPRERLGYMLEDSGLNILLTEESLLASLPESRAAVVRLDADWPEVERESARRPRVVVSQENLAYVIFTSGSTGRPKGVQIPHRAVVNFLHSMRLEPGLEERDALVAVTTLSFDIAALELFLPLAVGARLVLAGRATAADGRLLAALLEESGATVMQATPATWRQMIEAGWKGRAGLKVLCGGEALPRELARELVRAGGPVWNMYGPTETTIWSAVGEVSGDAGTPAVPVGAPIANTQIYVLDEGLRPAPVGAPGELLIGGHGLARGYLARPSLTADKFIPDPLSAEPGARLYRTGDLTAHLPEGGTEFLGRIDHQVKVRGFRIELGEIEAALNGHEAVRQCVAVVREEAGGVRRLVAYVVPAPDAAPDLKGLRAFVKERLPDYMVPSAFVVLGELPLTPNGKVDRKALPAPDGALTAASAESYVAPRTPAEEVLAGIWAEVLNVVRVGAEDDFFELGGHSLLATQVTSRVRNAFGVELPLRSLFEHTTVAALAVEIEERMRGGASAPTHALRPAARDRELPLSFAQQRLWFIDQLEPANPAYHVPAAFSVEGALNVAALAQGLAEIARRHEVLRTGFASVEGRPVQVIDDEVDAPLPVTDLSALRGSSRRAAVRRLALAEARRPFDLARGPLLRGTLLRTGEREHVLLVTAHHVASDAWSMGVFVRELAALYESFSRGARSPLAELELQYADYAVWQREWLSGPALEGQLSYWRRQLEGAPPALDLPTDRPRPAAQSFRGALARTTLPAGLTGALGELGRREGVTNFMSLLAAFQTLLHRHTNQDDIVVGTPIAGRTRTEVEGLIGFFDNTLALRTDLSGDPTFRELLARVREVTLGAYAHQDLPFERLVEELQPERSLSHTPLFQVMFVMENTPRSEVRCSGLTLGALDVDRETAKFDLLVTAREAGGVVEVSAEYSVELFDEATVARLLEHFRTLLASAVANPDANLSALELLSPEEERQLLSEWNDTAADFGEDGLVALFNRQRGLTPDAVAVTHGGVHVTYAQLNARAERLARHLRALGVGPDARVGVLLERSIELAVGLLAVVKCGAAYVPLDPNYPAERVAVMAEDSRMAALLTEESLRERLPDTSAIVILLDEGQGSATHDGSTSVRGADLDDALAYVIYTSGSTGRPKGVAMTRGCLSNLMRWQLARWGRGAAARTLQFTSLSFDVSFQEFFSTWLAGGTLVLVADDVRRDPSALWRLMREESVERLFLPYVALRQLAQAAAEGERAAGSLRQVITAGEALRVDRAVVSLFESLSRCTLENQYGPSETHVVTAHELNGGPGAWPGLPPIGRPVSNCRAYVLDGRLRPVPASVAGELYLGGVGLGRGYLHRAAQTAEKFVPDPFSVEPGARLYRTGDLARWRADGELDFLGRNDQQVKIRGYRVEPGEVETLLGGHPSLAEAAVVARDDANGVKRLVAYVVPAPGDAVEVKALRSFVKERLPDYMVPSAFVTLEKMPLTPSGKVDRRRLPAPDASDAEGGAASVAPRTQVEEVLAGIWAEVLNVSRVGAEDNFFDLGGHSLLATQVVSRVRHAFNVEVPLRAVFEMPNLSALARVVEQGLRGGAAAPTAKIVPAGRDRELPLSFAQQRLWLLDQLAPGDSNYNNSTALRLTGRLNAHALEQCLSEIVRRHEVLRTNFRAEGGEPRQVIAHARTVGLPLVDLRALPAGRREAELLRLANEGADLSFDLARDPLLRARLFRLGDDEHVALLTMHHIVSDAWSVGVLVREVVALYASFAEGNGSPLPELEVQYADFAVWQREWLQGDVLESHLDYWRRQLGGRLPVLRLPADRERAESEPRRGARQHFEVPAALHEELKRLSRAHGVSLFMTVLAGFKSLLYRHTNQTDIVVGADIANRDYAETESLVGFFVNMLVLRTDLSGSPQFTELLGRVREVTLGAYAHQDLPFERLVEELQPERSAGRSPLFQVVFNFINTQEPSFELPRLAVAHLPLGRESVRFDLSLFMVEGAGGLGGFWAFDAARFDPATVKRMSDRFLTLLAAAVSQPEARLDALVMTSEEERDREAAESARRERGIKKLVRGSRRAVELSHAGVVAAAAPDAGSNGQFPLVLRPEVGDVDLAQWAAAQRDSLLAELARRGALLFRGFEVKGVREFEKFAGALGGELMDYSEPSTPRRKVERRVYTSTEYPAERPIPLHNEMSYSHVWPMKVWFYCAAEPETGGETPIADSRRVFDFIDPRVRERFAERGVMYVRNYGGGLGLPWQEVFRTDDRAMVEAFCAGAGVEFEWLGGERLRTRQVRRAVAAHPHTGEMVWFNQAHVHHLSSLDAEAREAVLAVADDPDYPLDINARYGDGSPIEESALAEVREAYRRAAVSFPWREGDILMLDNMLAAHGRAPFTGPRRILVAMAEPSRP